MKKVVMLSSVLLAFCLAGCQKTNSSEETAESQNPAPRKPYIISQGEVGNGGHGKVRNGKV